MVAADISEELFQEEEAHVKGYWDSFSMPPMQVMENHLITQNNYFASAMKWYFLPSQKLLNFYSASSSPPRGRKCYISTVIDVYNAAFRGKGPK